MPYNGTGVFQRVYQWEQDAANGIFVDATRTDTDSNDIAAGLTNCVTRDGQSPWLDNLPAGGFKITGLANGSNASDSVNYGQVFSSPTFTSPSIFANPSLTDNSLLIPSTSWVQQIAFQTVLPGQGGHANELLTTDGTNASFSPLLKSATMRWADSSDTTKLLAFDISAFTTATTRTATWPNKSGTVAMTTDIGMRLLQTITPTVAANIDFLSLFDSTYDDYLIVGDGINHDGTGGTTQNLRIRLSNGGVVDSGSNYFSNGLAAASTTTSATDSQLSANTINSGRGANFEIKVQNVNSSGGLKSAVSFSTSQSTATPTLNSASNNLAYVGGVVSGARLFWGVGANFAAQGTIKIYGISKT
jgi:hypothetical protein